MRSAPKIKPPSIPNPATQANAEQMRSTGTVLFAPPSLVSRPAFIRRASTQKRELVGGGGSA